MMKRITPAMLAFVIHCGAVHAVNVRPLLDAIRQVETGGMRNPMNAVGADGSSLGPYQISRAYWRDSGVPGDYGQVRSNAYAERVIVAYWKRYCGASLRASDWQTLARVHNGGPRGAEKTATLRYWDKVNQSMRLQAKRKAGVSNRSARRDK